MPTTAEEIADPARVRLGLPKGHMQKAVLDLLAEAGLKLRQSSRGYRPWISLDGFEVKVLKPQNIVKMLHAGSRDIGFAGADWVAELDVELVEVLDTGFNPVRLVAAAPAESLVDGQLPQRPLVVASEYERLTKDWIDRTGLQASFVRSYGATEVFPPEDADCIVDNTATGSTLRANGLEIVGEVMQSSTRLFANPQAMSDPCRRESIDHFVLLLNSVLAARQRVMIEFNVTQDTLQKTVSFLPCMRQPTVSSLLDDQGFAVKAAVPRDSLPALIRQLREQGGTDIVVTQPAQIVP